MAVSVRASGPSAAVLHAFGADGRATVLSGGQGATYRVADIVVKPVDDAAEAAWTQELLTRVRTDRFRIARASPDRATACGSTTGGQRRGSSADCDRSRRDGVSSSRPGCGSATRPSKRRQDDQGVLAARTHRWAVADRVVWGEQSTQLDDERADLFAAMSAEFGDDTSTLSSCTAISAATCSCDEDGTPVILDVSPYVRPRQPGCRDRDLRRAALAQRRSRRVPADSSTMASSLVVQSVGIPVPCRPAGERCRTSTAMLQNYRTVIAALR